MGCYGYWVASMNKGDSRDAILSREKRASGTGNLSKVGGLEQSQVPIDDLLTKEQVADSAESEEGTER